MARQPRLEWTPGYSYSNLLLKAGSAVRSDKVSQGFIYPGYGEDTAPLGKLFQCLIVHMVKRFSSYIHSEPLFLQLIPSVTMQHYERICLLFHSNLIMTRARIFGLPKAFSLAD